MPLYHKPKIFKPLSVSAVQKSIKNGLHHGIFNYKFDKYKGDWKNDMKEGKGLFLTTRGKLYEGDWYNNLRHGFGALSHRLPDGRYELEYRGEWIQDKPEGTGWRYYKNGNVYFGFWKRGQRHGYGKMWYNNGTFYVGYWNMNKREGLGMFVQEDGNRYEGHWSADVKNGLGRFYHMHTGQLQEGCWSNNFCVKSKMSDITIRQFCELPTKYPVPPVTLLDSRRILEEDELWLQQKIGDLNKNLQYCIDQI